MAPPFISQKKVWFDEEFPDKSLKVPEDITKNIVDNLGFTKPSVIQSIAIPHIRNEPFNNVIAQSKNGSGKTGAFAIGSTLRVDRENPAP